MRFPAQGGREGLQEPIVHKVVLGGGSATAPIDLLELLRTNSPVVEPAPRPALAEPRGDPSTAAFQAVPAPPPGSPLGQPNEGFTQLLRALSGDSSPASAAEQPVAAKRAVVSSDSRLSRPESEFTSSVRTRNANDGDDQLEKRPNPLAPPRSTPPSQGVGSFTALLQGFSGSGPDSGEPQPKPLYENPGPASSALPHTAPAYDAEQPKPGAFTQLFSALTPEATNLAAAQPAATKSRAANPPAIYTEHNSMSRPSGEQASFTQLISTIGEPSPGTPAYRGEPLGSNQPPTGITGWSSASAPRLQPESSAGGGGLTQLIRTLDEPAKGLEQPSPYPPVDQTPTPADGSIFTQAYKKLDQPVNPSSPVPPPAYSPPSRLSATQVYQPPLTGGIFPAASAPNLPAGPSEVTRILDASKLREMQRQGIAAPPAGPAVAAQPSPSQPAMPMPPVPPYLQWQPPQVPPAPLPGQPLQFNPAMQMPQFMPPAQVPPIPAPALAAPPALGKMQQYLPLFAIIIIFLLIVILVTVVFLLKH
jgi:hypothetical protein